MPIERDPVLESLSDKVRAGEPVGLIEAYAVVEYQARLRAEREVLKAKTLRHRVLVWFRRLVSPKQSGASGKGEPT